MKKDEILQAMDGRGWVRRAELGGPSSDQMNALYAKRLVERRRSGLAWEYRRAGEVQMAERRSPKPDVGGSTPPARAISSRDLLVQQERERMAAARPKHVTDWLGGSA